MENQEKVALEEKEIVTQEDKKEIVTQVTKNPKRQEAGRRGAAARKAKQLAEQTKMTKPVEKHEETDQLLLMKTMLPLAGIMVLVFVGVYYSQKQEPKPVATHNLVEDKDDIFKIK